MMQAVPGAYFWVGHEGSVPVHNPGYVLDDKILPIGASMFARIIETRLPVGCPCINRHRRSGHLAARSQRRRPDRGLSRQAVLAVGSAGGRAGACRGVGAAHQGAVRCSIPTARARSPRHRPNAGRRASRSARSTACRSRSRTISPPRAMPVPLGAASVKLVPAAEDAPPAARLREAGAVIFSKTTMPDYGMLSSGLSSFHPLTRNPWDLSKNPGGSSFRRGRGGRGRLRPAASRHRYRRLGAAAGLLVRPGRAEAEPRAHSGRSALCRPRRRTDDPHRR